MRPLSLNFTICRFRHSDTAANLSATIIFPTFSLRSAPAVDGALAQGYGSGLLTLRSLFYSRSVAFYCHCLGFSDLPCHSIPQTPFRLFDLAFIMGRSFRSTSICLLANGSHRVPSQDTIFRFGSKLPSPSNSNRLPLLWFQTFA